MKDNTIFVLYYDEGCYDGDEMCYLAQSVSKLVEPKKLILLPRSMDLKEMDKDDFMKTIEEMLTSLEIDPGQYFNTKEGTE